MSLVSCIMADMQYTMMDSDCEDKAANITAKLKNITEQGAEIGKQLANLDTQIDQAKYAFRELEGQKSMMAYSQNSSAQNVVGAINQRQAYCQQVFAAMQQRKMQLEAEKRKFQVLEKELTAEQTKNNAMKKFAEGASQMFKGFADKAISRFFGGGGGR